MRKIFFSLLFLLFGAFSAIAAPKYEADVHVDEKADTVTKAKKNALSKAMRQGLSEIVLSISTDKSVEEINKLNDNQLQHFITGVMVLMEKTSDVRYIADLRISVDEKILRAYMAENEMPVVLGEEKEVLVVPLLEREDGGVDLWGDENLWREAFLKRKNLRKGNLDIHVIDKNLGNITAVKANRVYDMSDEEYQNLAEFNRADMVYVLKYSLKDKKVYVKEFPSNNVQDVLIESADGIEDMIDKTTSLFRDDKKKTQATKGGFVQVAQQMEVVYNYERLAQWMSLKQILDNNPQVQDIRIISMVNGKVHFNFKYSGVLEKLQGSLDMNGYKLKAEGEHYVIY